MLYRTKRMLRWLTAFVVIVGLAAGIVFYIARNAFPGAGLLKHADRTEVFRVATRALRASPVPHINGYPILKTGAEQGPEFTRRLTQVLLSSGMTRNETKCPLEPRIAFRIWSGTQSVDVLVGFDCNLLWPHVVGEPLSESPKDDWKSFDATAASNLRQLSQEVFPNDRDLKVRED
jgi:hypothetical protein